MSKALNPNVIAFVPRSVEAAAKAMRPDSLNSPLPLSAQPPRQMHQPLARHIISSVSQAHRLERMEKVRIIEPRAAPSKAPCSKPCYRKTQGPNVQDPKVDGPKVQGRKRPQRRGKQPLFDYSAKRQNTNRPKKSLPKLCTPPAVDGSALDRREQVPRQCGQIQNLQTGTKQAGGHHPSCLPKTQKKLVQRTKQNEKEMEEKYAVAKTMQLQEEGDPQGEACGVECMGGKTFKSNHSAVLAMKTIWCPRSWRDEQEDAKWPQQMHFAVEGFDRHKNGYGRFLPVPRSEEFQWRLATMEWLANPKATKYPVWNGKGPVPHQEKRFARVRSEMDCIIGTGLCVDELLLFDRAEQVAWEDPAGIIGRQLWEEIAYDKREGFKEVRETEGGVYGKEEDMGLRKWLWEEAEEKMDKEVREGVD